MNALAFDLDSALGIEGGDIDDALALVYLASLPKAGGLELITAVGGNVTLESVVRSSFFLCDLCGLTTDLAIGAEGPLDRPLRTGHSIAMGGSSLEERWIYEHNSARKPHELQAWDALAQLAQQRPISLLATAPLTNVAIFLEKYPHLQACIEDVVTMGGWFVGDQRQAEFNIMVDPVAAQRAFSSNLPMTIVPLEMTLQTWLSPKDIEPWREMGKAGLLLYEGAISWMNTVERLLGRRGCNLHDPLAAVGLVHPDIFDLRGIIAHVDTESGCTEIVAYEADSPIKIVNDFDRERFKKELLCGIENLLVRQNNRMMC